MAGLLHNPGCPVAGQAVATCNAAAFCSPSACRSSAHPLASASGERFAGWRLSCHKATKFRNCLRSKRGIASPVRSAAGGDQTGKSGSKPARAADDRTSVIGPDAKSHLDMLNRFTGQSNEAVTISEQLASIYESESSDDETELTVPLSNAEKLEPPPLTIHQKRNIRRQSYLNEVAKRNDGPFFAGLALLFLLPPFCILGFAIATGYVEIFP